MSMRTLAVVLFACSIFGAFHWWSGRSVGSIAVTANANGFFPVEMPGGATRNVVLVLASPNCPSDEAQRTEALVAALSREGIPVAQGSSFSFNVADPTAEQVAGIDRAVEIFKRGAPAVYVNGMAMSNPTAAQTVAEYRRIRR